MTFARTLDTSYDCKSLAGRSGCNKTPNALTLNLNLKLSVRSQPDSPPYGNFHLHWQWQSLPASSCRVPEELAVRRLRLVSDSE